ncbi:MAG TPA: glycosyltransferase [Candidatus Limnocylindrales bacterium]
MNGELRGRTAERGLAVGDAASALQQLDGQGIDEPILLAYHPIARMNPFQALLYSRAWRHGIAAVPLHNLDELDDVAAVARGAGARQALHLHWTNKILEGSADEREARSRLAAFSERLDRFAAGGGSIVWTVHNTLPHDARMPAMEAALQQAIVDRAAVVHVLSANTPAAVGEWFSIPQERVLHVPHPSYVGAYVDTISPEAARWELGVPAGDTVYALLGAIKPYKGLDQMLDAFDAAIDRGRGTRRLIVAGGPSRDPEVDAFLERCLLHPFVSLHARKIPGDDMQLFLRAADIAVMPYLRSLNSGVLMLALSFGLPVVAPAVGAMAETITPRIGRTFVPGDRESLTDALLAADALRTPEARAAALDVAREHDPHRLSERFSRELVRRLRVPRPAPA